MTRNSDEAVPRNRACARAMAEEIAITRSQSQGILMNPHFQEIEVWPGA